MGTAHVKDVAEIKGSFITVPSPVGIRVREMALAGAAFDTVPGAVTDFMPLGGGMGMDTDAIAGKRKACLRDGAVFQGGQDGGKAEGLLEPVHKMERGFRVFQGISGQLVHNAGMLIGALLPFAGLFRKLSILIFRERFLPASPLGNCGLIPEPVHQVKIRFQRWEEVRVTADQGSRQAVGLQLLEPGSQAADLSTGI